VFVEAWPLPRSGSVTDLVTLTFELVKVLCKDIAGLANISTTTTVTVQFLSEYYVALFRVFSAVFHVVAVS